jgi:hypothetical protein
MRSWKGQVRRRAEGVALHSPDCCLRSQHWPAPKVGQLFAQQSSHPCPVKTTTTHRNVGTAHPRGVSIVRCGRHGRTRSIDCRRLQAFVMKVARFCFWLCLECVERYEGPLLTRNSSATSTVHSAGSFLYWSVCTTESWLPSRKRRRCRQCSWIR